VIPATDAQVRAFQRGALIIGAALIFALTLALIVTLGRGCYVTTIAVGIDAGPGDREIAARLDGAVMEQRERIARLEAQHAGEIAAMQAGERAEYERVRAQGDRKRLARWFRERSARLLQDGGT
jgi:hypothetical protein